jgi:hypothetical protein
LGGGDCLRRQFGHGFGPLAVLIGIAPGRPHPGFDRRSRPKLFPTAFPGFLHPVSLGLWVLVLMPLAEAAVYVYGPYIPRCIAV